MRGSPAQARGAQRRSRVGANFGRGAQRVEIRKVTLR